MGSASGLDALRKQLSEKGAVILPGEDGYEDGIKRWSDTCEKRAMAVVQPASAEDVSAAIKFLVASKIAFTTVGGGHSTSGSSAIADGVTIDLRRHMCSVTVDPEAKTVTVQGGATWAAVNDATVPHGLATVGGTVDHTGVGGLALGGGYGWLSGRYGLSVDNMLAATMVLADGRIVKTSATHEPDLFWAVRGAGQCFGVCTEFVFRLHPQREMVYAGLMVWTPDKLAQIVDFVNELGARADPDTTMSWGFGAPPPAKQPVLLALVFHNGDEEAGRAAFQPLKDLGPVMDSTGMVTYQRVNKLFNDTAGPGGRKLFGGSNFTMPVSADAVQGIMDEFLKVTLDPALPGANESMLVFEYVPYAAQNAVPVAACAFANRGEYYNVGLLWKWDRADDDDKFRAFTRHFSELTRERVGTTRQQDVGQYANYLGVTEKTERVFGSNTPRLRQLKAKYDPDGCFNRWHDLRPLPN